MAALFAPARLLPSSIHDNHHETNRNDWECVDTSITSRHDYLHSLALGQDGVGFRDDQAKEPPSEAFRVSWPRSVAAPEWCKTGKKLSLRPSLALYSMASVVERTTSREDNAPSSPPGLSYSKSSRDSSSSIRSNSSDEESSTEKQSPSADVSVECVVREDIDDSNLPPENRPTLRRPPMRSTTMIEMGKRASPPIGTLDGRRPGWWSPAYGGILRDQYSNLPVGSSIRRDFMTGSTPALVTRDSRSPSPSKPFTFNGVNVSPQSLASATPKLFTDPSSPSSNAIARRKSWQPTAQRKTAKELEAEYNDDDEHVPDGAVLENVPFSPVPGQPRLSPTSSRAESRSTTPSPQRTAFHSNMHSANVPKRAKRPSAPSPLPNGLHGSPRSPKGVRPAMMPHGATIAEFSPEMLSRKHRSKSWTEDLNEEARQLSAALEDYAERMSAGKPSMERALSRPTSVTNSPPRPDLSMKRAKTTVVELPPVQRCNVMIDPLPISKEKEAVLTRTRPSWLPPKDQREERKHVREWERMMARAAENEKKRALKQREAVETEEEMKGSIARIWEQHVLPNWDAVIHEPRTRELWWRGVTPRSRGVVWQRGIGNELELSGASFEAALNRANELQESLAEIPEEQRAASKQVAWLDAISRDVRHACPNLAAAEKRAPFEAALHDVLKAYAMYRNDVGYVYGTHLVAGILCLHLRPADAFVALANILNRPLPLAFLVHDTAAMSRAYDLVLSTLKYKYGKLHSHLTSPSTAIRPEEFLEPMFRCLFAYNLPTAYVTRIWDLFVFEGDKALVRSAVAVLGKLEGKLYGTREEILELISWRNQGNWVLGTEEEFIMAVREAGKVDPKAEGRPPNIVA